MKVKSCLLMTGIICGLASIMAHADVVRDCQTANGHYRVVVRSTERQLTADIYEGRARLASYPVIFHRGLPIGRRTEYRDVRTNGAKFDLAFQSGERFILLNAVVRDRESKLIRIQDDDVRCGR
jgi:hypothetical protein